MSDKSYNEQTRVRPRDHAEIYGQDGYGWYTYADTANELAALAAKSGKPITLRAGANPLFLHLEGVTGRRLNGWGFILSDD